jgi:hypothetical protein|nr:MAG TPA: protein of unknown function (UPF0154) [Caudoviricetes sp.]
MSNFWKTSLAFVAGAIVGGFVAKKYIEYKSQINDDVEYEECETQEAITEEANDTSVENEETSNDEIKIRSIDDEAYKKLLADLQYSVEKEAEDFIERTIPRLEEVRDTSKPYNITPDEFEEIDEYDSDEYTYYADGYVTDSYGMPISDEDILNTIGEDFDTYFGSYDDDQIWIRNERLRMDFSVVRDIDRFVDVAPPRIRRMVGL